MTIERPTLVTGNEHKLADFKRVLYPFLPYNVQDFNIDEIQGPGREDIITAKAQSAFEIARTPVIVEDVTAGLEMLNGMPGPFIKQFEASIGEDALLKLVTGPNKRAVVTSTIALYDGQSIIIGKGETHGTVVPMRGDNSYGFDKVFMPDNQPGGAAKTIAEMSLAEKDAVSERAMSVRDLLKRLSVL